MLKATACLQDRTRYASICFKKLNYLKKKETVNAETMNNTMCALLNTIAAMAVLLFVLTPLWEATISKCRLKITTTIKTTWLNGILIKRVLYTGIFNSVSSSTSSQFSFEAHQVSTWWYFHFPIILKCWIMNRILFNLILFFSSF